MMCGSIVAVFVEVRQALSDILGADDGACVTVSQCFRNSQRRHTNSPDPTIDLALLPK